MTVEIALAISIISVGFSLYQGFSGMRRDRSSDDRNEATQLTTVIVKLENIGNGIAELKSKLNNFEIEIREARERIVIVEESTKAAHKRMDNCEKFCKRFLNPEQ